MIKETTTRPVELGTDAPPPTKLYLWVSNSGELTLSEKLPTPGWWKSVKTVDEADAQRFDIWARQGRTRLITEPLIERETYAAIRTKIGLAK